MAVEIEGRGVVVATHAGMVFARDCLTRQSVTTASYPVSDPGKTYRSENFRTASRLPISPTRVPNPTRAAGSKSIC
jgi:hypothetical protein